MLLLESIFVIINVSCLSCFINCSLQPCGHLLGKDWPFGALVCYVLMCFCHFPMWCPGSGVILDCPDLCLLTYFHLKKMIVKEKQCYIVQTFEEISSFNRLYKP